MPAIVTDALRRQIAQDFFDQFTEDTRKYYIGIGRSEQWDSSETVPTPTNSPQTIQAFRNALQGVKKVEATSLVVPRNNWASGVIYSQFDDQQAGYPTSPYYVKNEANQVYVCLEVGRNAAGTAVPSTNEPTHSNNDARRLADGYVWKFLYTISAASANSFMSSNFMPVQVQGATDSNSTGIQLKQEEVQNNAKAGEILNLVITDGGAGYSSLPTITITGTGSNASFIPAIDSATGRLVRLRAEDSSNGDVKGFGTGYTRAIVSITGGGASQNATARAVLGPDSGMGKDPREDLRSTSVMFHSDLLGTDSDLIVNQDFRQVGLIRDPKTSAGAAFLLTTGNSLKSMTLSSIVTEFTADKTILGSTTAAKAIIDEIDSNQIFYHQTDDTGFLTFQDGELITETNGAGDGVIDSALRSPEVDPETGARLYIDNRKPVSRALAQNEDIKVVVQF